MYIPHVSTVMMAEAIAMKEGLALANRLGYNVVEAESDSTDVIEACKGGEIWWNEAAAIFADCVDYATSIGTVFFKHCPRETTEVAHTIARHSFNHKISCNWVDEPPGFMLDALLNDVIL